MTRKLKIDRMICASISMHWQRVRCGFKIYKMEWVIQVIERKFRFFYPNVRYKFLFGFQDLQLSSLLNRNRVWILFSNIVKSLCACLQWIIFLIVDVLFNELIITVSNQIKNVVIWVIFFISGKIICPTI